MWARPDCPEWTCRAPVLPGQRLASGLCPSVPAHPSVLFLSLPAPLQSVPPRFSFVLRPSLPALLSFLPGQLPCVCLLLLFSASWLHWRRVWSQAFYQSARHPSYRFGRHRSPTLSPAAIRAASLPSSLLLSARTFAKIGNPFDDVGVARNEPVVCLVMFQRARVVPEVQVAQNGKIPVRVVKVGKLCQCRFVTRARLLKFSLAPLHQAELVVCGGVVWIQFHCLAQAGLGAVQIPSASVCNTEIDVRCR